MMGSSHIPFEVMLPSCSFQNARNFKKTTLHNEKYITDCLLDVKDKFYDKIIICTNDFYSENL